MGEHVQWHDERQRQALEEISNTAREQKRIPSNSWKMSFGIALLVSAVVIVGFLISMHQQVFAWGPQGFASFLFCFLIAPPAVLLTGAIITPLIRLVLRAFLSHGVWLRIATICVATAITVVFFLWLWRNATTHPYVEFAIAHIPQMQNFFDAHRQELDTARLQETDGRPCHYLFYSDDNAPLMRLYYYHSVVDVVTGYYEPHLYIHKLPDNWYLVIYLLSAPRNTDPPDVGSIPLSLEIVTQPFSFE